MNEQELNETEETGDFEERDRKLAEAWKSLAGLHVGMVMRNGQVLDREAVERASRERGALVFCNGVLWLPELTSPSNWGIWYAWVQREIGKRPKWLDFDDGLPYSLLAWYIEELDREGHSCPSEALPWWLGEDQGVCW